MNQHTHNLTQYAIPLGRKLMLYRRPKPTGKQAYTAPRLVGVEWFKSKAEAMEFKQKFDA